jgi:hypothetical protein
MLSPNGPGPRGSLPALVMRTGLIRPTNITQARRDLDTRHILEETSWPVNRAPMSVEPTPPPPMVAPIPALPSPVTTAVAQTTTATPPMPLPNAPTTDLPHSPSDQHHWHRGHRHMHPMVKEIQRLHPHANIHGSEEPQLGADAEGRPVAKFSIAASPPAITAQSSAHNLRLAARALYMSGLHALPPELVGGPLAALMRGGAVELHFQNGVVVRTTP